MAVVFAVLNRATQQINAYTPITKTVAASAGAVPRSKRQFGTGKQVPASRVDRRTNVRISGDFFYEHVIDGKGWHEMVIIRGWSLDRVGRFAGFDCTLQKCIRSNQTNSQRRRGSKR